MSELFDSGVPVNAKLRESIEQVEDSEILSDLVAYNFISSIEARQRLLEMASLQQRFEFLLDRLRKMKELIVE